TPISSERMSWCRKLMRRASVAIARGSGLLAMSDAACWARSNENLRVEGRAPTAVHRREGAAPFVVVQQMAQAKTKTPQPTPAIGHEPSGADFVNGKLNPGSSDPNVPLPRAGLTEEAAGPDALKGTQLYGQSEEHTSD